MNTCSYEPYTLPTIDFVGGETQKFVFHAFFHNKQNPMDLSGCVAKFAIVEYTNKTGDTIWSKNMDIVGDDDGSTLLVTINSSDTINLSGKYIYQITIQSSDGVVEIPKQGILYITKNIDKGSIVSGNFDIGALTVYDSDGVEQSEIPHSAYRVIIPVTSSNEAGSCVIFVASYKWNGQLKNLVDFSVNGLPFGDTVNIPLDMKNPYNDVAFIRVSPLKSYADMIPCGNVSQFPV